MGSKEFLSPETIRNNAIILASKIHSDNFIPTIIYVSLRGGATFGNVISEYFKLASHINHLPLYALVVAHSYTTFTSEDVHIDGWTYPPQSIRPSDSVMLIDDIFDSGKTINIITQELLKTGVSRRRLKIVVHDYKIRKFKSDAYEFSPDYYSRKIIIETPEQDNWIHYLSHEIDGLTDDEVRENYPLHIHEHLLRLLHTRKKHTTKIVTCIINLSVIANYNNHIFMELL